ncbi:hypothetical protein CWE09_03830 [Aliidiomarina minuta]|uniref:HTH luxR-type domain-containing protein n=1 Tax=Aliidiomarina minuta TaxID=880057 RepID=A0A432W722_9GAMM|nr:response regulator transcription factor [Aliidiomarina minuta]RUO25867.1 hypothetical protein CWE09_03830 [Aliidiomarina minuta]
MRQIILAVPRGIYRSGLASEIRSEGWRVDDTVNNRHELLAAVDSNYQKLIILSADFCSQGSKSLIRAMKRVRSDTKVLFWSFDLICAIDHFTSEQGIDGYIYQYVETQEVLKACSVLHRGQRYLTPYLASLFRRLRDQNEQQPLLKGLSKRERQVLQLLCSGATVTEIAQRLYISRKTVNTFRYRLFKKTGVSGDVKLTHIAIGTGLIPLTPIPKEEGVIPVLS